jgi:hypothetical protein
MVYCVSSLEFSFVFMHHLVVSVMMFRRNVLPPPSGWLKYVQMLAEVTEEETCWLCEMGRVHSVGHGYRRHEERLGLF